MNGRILGCADGPASFNAEATARGHSVTSCDPLYRFEVSAIRQQVEHTFPTVLEQTRKNAGEFLWTPDLPDVESLGKRRLETMHRFLADYEAGKSMGRYVDAELPRLPFADDSFDLAICSHFLFLYSDQFTEDFHVASILELSRVSEEVRIFPLLKLGSLVSPHVPGVVRRLQALGFAVTIELVRYEFQRGGNQMLRIHRERALSR